MPVAFAHAMCFFQVYMDLKFHLVKSKSLKEVKI